MKTQHSHKKKKNLETNENEIYQNLWDAAKAVLRGKLLVINTYIRKNERSQVKKSCFTPQETRKRRTNKPKVSRRKEIIKIRAEINEIETKKQ